MQADSIGKLLDWLNEVRKRLAGMGGIRKMTRLAVKNIFMISSMTAWR